MKFQLGLMGCALLIALGSMGCSDDASTGIPYTAGELSVETSLSVNAVAVGGNITGECTVTHVSLGVVSVGTTILTNPVEGVRVTGKTITAEAPGLYNIGCAVSALPEVYDATPETIIVTTSGAAGVDTVLTPAETTPGEKSTVECIATDWSGNVVEAETTFIVMPEEGVTIDGDTISSDTTGVFEVICSLAEVPSVVDSKPAKWTVVSSDPVRVIAELDSDSIPSGEKTLVKCLAEDESGNLISDLNYTVTGDETGVTITEMEIVGVVAGEYEIGCVVEGFESIESTPDFLTVTAGTAVEIELFVDPEQNGYMPGTDVTFSWIVKDSKGNQLENPEVTLAAPATGVELVTENTYKLLDEGAHSFTAIAANGQGGASTTRVLYVDSGAPELVVTYPTRGLTLTDDAFVQVEGTIIDPVSGVADLTINGSKVSVGDDGTFTFSIQSGHGLNVVDVQGIDAAGNVSSQVIGYYYSTSYQNYEETTIEDVMIEEAMKVFLGKEVIDDGVHDFDNVDDLATLIEVVLTTADLDALLGAAIEPIIIPGVVNEPGGGQPGDIDLFGNLVISFVFTETSVSEDMVINLTPIDGGIQANGSIPPVTTESGLEEDGLVLQLSLNVALELTAQTTIDAGGFIIPAEATLTPTFSTQTYASVNSVDFATTYLIGKNAGGPLNVDGKNFSIVLGEIEIDPIQDTEIDLGTIEFEVLGFPLPVSIPVGVIPLADLFDPVGDLIGGLLTPVSNFLSSQLGFIFQPILEDVAAETLKAALLSLELDTQLEIPALSSDVTGEVDVFGQLHTVSFTTEGGTVGLKAGAWAEKVTEYTPLGSILRDSCSGTDPGAFAFSEDVPMAIALNMDFVNEFLFSAWWNGLLNIETDESGFGDAGLGLSDYGIKSIRLNPLLPPILSDCNSKGLLHIQLGDAELELDLDGGLVTEPTTMKLFTSMDADIYVITNADSISVVVNGFSGFHVDIVDAGPEWESLEAELEVALEAIMVTQMEELLGQALGDFPVPSIDLTGLLEGVPEGTALEVGSTDTALSNGFLLVEGDLQ